MQKDDSSSGLRILNRRHCLLTTGSAVGAGLLVAQAPAAFGQENDTTPVRTELPVVEGAVPVTLRI